MNPTLTTSAEAESEQASDARDVATLRTLERGLKMLEVLAAAPGGLGFGEVIERIGLSTGTVNRLLQTLVRRGYVEQDKRAKTYRLGLRVLELQASSLASNRMAAEARPQLRSLLLRTGRRVNLAVFRGGDHLVYIDRVDNEESLGRYAPVGRGGPLHATSLGKAIIAYSPSDVVEAYLATSKRDRLTPNTIVDAGDLRTEYEGIRARGYAMAMEESAPGTYCIGAPIFDYTGEVVAAVSIAGSKDEIVPDFEAKARVVMEAATQISESFGARTATGARD
jgi:IclR family KDG regulon transcriptional repressor